MRVMTPYVQAEMKMNEQIEQQKWTGNYLMRSLPAFQRTGRSFAMHGTIMH